MSYTWVPITTGMIAKMAEHASTDERRVIDEEVAQEIAHLAKNHRGYDSAGNRCVREYTSYSIHRNSTCEMFGQKISVMVEKIIKEWHEENKAALELERREERRRRERAREEYEISKAEEAAWEREITKEKEYRQRKQAHEEYEVANAEEDAGKEEVERREKGRQKKRGREADEVVKDEEAAKEARPRKKLRCES